MWVIELQRIGSSFDLDQTSGNSRQGIGRHPLDHPIDQRGTIRYGVMDNRQPHQNGLSNRNGGNGWT
jgi:hypothetical protein